MLAYINLSRYLPGYSYLHKLDPRTKFFSTILLVFLIFNIRSPYGYLLLGIFTAIMISLARINLYTIYQGLKPFFIIIGLTVLLQIFLITGQPLVNLKIVTISREGVMYGLALGFKLILALIVTTLLTLTTEPLALTDGLEKAFHPLKKLKVPVSELALMITITVRFIPTLLEEAQMIMKAQAARGVEFASGSLPKRAKNIAGILVPLIVGSFRRADELATAMESRGFQTGAPRTRMNPLKFTRLDLTAGVAMVLLIVAFYLTK